jgi:prepilin-type N-terminal cleavage/methylation domain-containing protein
MFCMSDYFCMSNNPRLNLSQGLTLVELLIALLISSIVMASFVLFGKSFFFTTDTFIKDISTHLYMRSFLEQINFHASQAGFSPVDTVMSNSIQAEVREPIWIDTSGPSGGVNAIQFTYDTSTTRREYALYEIKDLTRKGRAEKAIYITRTYKQGAVNMIMSQQLILAGVKQFNCSKRVTLGYVRALDCALDVYKKFSPETDSVRYEFSISSPQSY